MTHTELLALKRTSIRLATLGFCLLSLVWPGHPVAGDVAQAGLEPRLLALAVAQDKKDHERERKLESFKSGRELLLKHGVPFDSDILLEGDWASRLAPVFATMPEFKEVRQGRVKMEGVQIADTLLLPEHVELTDDTVLMARQLVFSGKNVVIRGPHSLTFFPMEPVLTLDNSLENSRGTGSASFATVGISIARFLAVAKAHGRLVRPEGVTINLNGSGRDEWLLKKKFPPQV